MKKTSKIIAILIPVLLITLMFGGVVSAGLDPGESSTGPKLTRESVPEYVEDEILVKFKSYVTDKKIKSINSTHGTKTKKKIPKINVYVIKIPEGTSVFDMVESYKKEPNVEYAEPNHIAHILLTPNDPGFSLQWNMNNIGQTLGTADADIDAPEAWDINTGDPNVIIAIIDTGVALYHPEFDGKFWLNSAEIPVNGIDDDANGYVDDYRGYNFSYNSNFPDDDHGHGTHCAGIAAAETDNGLGVAGISWSNLIMPVKVLNHNGAGTFGRISEGIIYAADNGADVISMSLGAFFRSQTLELAMEYAYNAGVVIICAAGNEYGPPVIYPAAFDRYCLAVAATNDYDERAYFSSTGPQVDVAAPGFNIYSTYRYIGFGLGSTYDEYVFNSGTSMACPHVAGLAALVLAQNPTYTNDQVMGQIKYTTEDVNSAKYPGEDKYLGAGRINAYQTLTVVPHSVVSYESHSIDDVSGNADGRVDAGETVNMVVTLKDEWVDASGLSATLSTVDPYVTITAGVADFGSILAGTTANNSLSPYTFSVSADCPKGHKIVFTLAITATGYSTSFDISVLTRPYILFVDDDGDVCLYDHYYTDALDTYGFAYDVWEVPFGADGPTAADMAPYEVVIWDALNVSKYDEYINFLRAPSLTVQDAASLSTYLDGGGNLLIVSCNLMGVYGGAPAEVSTFVQQYLHVSEWAKANTDYIEGVPADLVDGINLFFPNAYSYLNVYSLTPDANATAMITINNPASAYNGTATAIRYPATGVSTYRTAFMGFDLPTTGNDEGRGFVMYQVANWLQDVTGTPPANFNPEADPGTGKVKEVMDIDGNGSESVNVYGFNSTDADGYITSYEWEEEGTIFGTGSTLTYDFTVGKHFITLKVTDDTGATDTAKTVVHVKPAQGSNAGPPVPLPPTGPTTLEPNTLYTYSATATDPEGSQIYYDFGWGEGETDVYDGLPQAYTVTELHDSGITGSAPHAWPYSGTFNVRVRAFDVYGQKDGSDFSAWSDPLVVTVINYNPPGIPTLTGPTLLTNALGDSGTYTASAVDPDGDPIKYDFDWDGSGTVTDYYPSGYTVQASHSWLSAGTYSVTVTATDTGGLSTVSDPLIVVVQDVVPPLILNLAVSNITDSTATITWTTYEASDSVVNYGTTTALGSTVSDPALVISHSIPLTGLTPETTYYYEVQSTDAAGNTRTDNNGGLYYTFTASTLNNPPAAPVVPTGPTTGDAGVSYTYSASTTDPDGDQIKYTFDWADGTASETLFVASGTAASSSHVWNLSGIYNVIVKATDSLGAESAWSAPLTVTMSEPTNLIHVASITLSTSTWKKSGTYWANATAVVTIVDADGLPVEGATVSGSWSGLTADIDSGITDINGQVSLTSDDVAATSGTFTFTVDDVTATGWTYDPTSNVETSDSISL